MLRLLLSHAELPLNTSMDSASPPNSTEKLCQPPQLCQPPTRHSPYASKGSQEQGDSSVELVPGSEYTDTESNPDTILDPSSPPLVSDTASPAPVEPHLQKESAQLSRPTSYRPSRDTAFDIEHLSKVTRRTSDISPQAAYRYRYHPSICPRTIDSAIVSSTVNEALGLPFLRQVSQIPQDLPAIHGLFPELESRWQAKPLKHSTSLMPGQNRLL